MRTFFTQYKILAWIVMVLLLLNFTILATIGYEKIRKYKTQSGKLLERDNRQIHPGIYLREELNLTSEQYDSFHKARLSYQQSAQGLRRQILNNKRAYLLELMKDNPDTLLLKAACDSIGKINEQLMLAAGNYYREIKHFCSDEQAGRLNAFFIQAMITEDSPGMRGKNMRNRPRGRGPGFQNNNQ